MSNADPTGFGKFVPGFDFLQSLTQGAAGNNAAMPNFGKWVAPTLDVEELDKRIEELKIVRFWLEQNTNALGATIQALEVQKMTLATLKGMNFSFGDAAATAATAAKDAVAKDTAAKEAAMKETAAQEAAAQEAAAAKATTESDVKPKTNTIDPMQMWGALTQQFQKIAESAVKEASGAAAQATKAAATSVQKATTAAQAATKSAAPRAAATKPVRKPARKTTKRA